MTSRLGAWLAAAFVVMIGDSLATEQLPPHSRPPGVRVPALPPGEGGSLFIQAPRALCADNKNEFHLHDFPEPGAVQFVVEAPAGPSSCAWEFHDLAEGAYEALIQVAGDGGVIAKADANVEKGATASMTLRSLNLEIEGYVNSRGLPPKDLRLTFQPLFGFSMVPYGEATINEDGWYNVKLDGQHDRYCAKLSAKKAANHLSKCGEFYSGLERLDLEIAPGVIQVVVPPFTPTNDSMWAHVSLRRITIQPPPDAVIYGGGGFSTFKPKDGFRGHYMGIAYGEYVLVLTVDGDPAAVASAPVKLSADDATAAITLSDFGWSIEVVAP